MSPDALMRALERRLARLRSPFRAVMGGLSLGGRVQLASGEGLAGEPLKDLEVFQQFGVVSSGPEGTQMVVVPLGGRTSASVVVATEHGAYRLELDARGEVAIHNQDGDHVWLKRGGFAQVKASTQVLVDCPEVRTTGDMYVGGNLFVKGDITDQFETNSRTMAAGREVYNDHDHPENGNAGPTGKPNQEM